MDLESNKPLSPVQEARCDYLASEFGKLTFMELRYLSHVYSTILPISLPKREDNSAYLKPADLETLKRSGVWSGNHPNFLVQQEMLKRIYPLGAENTMSLIEKMAEKYCPEMLNAQTPEAAAPQEEAPKEVAAPQKSNFDIEISGYDSAKKIGTIKEVRAILGLGLKEAKELIDSVPAVARKSVLKDEAEEIKEKLEKAGCQVNLK